MNDIFGRKVQPGDKVAVGMAYNRSSVLRVGEVVSVNQKPANYGDGVKWTVRIKWTHNGPGDWTWDVKESNILGESTHRYAKLVILPDDFVEQFPPDIKQD